LLFWQSIPFGFLVVILENNFFLPSSPSKPRKTLILLWQQLKLHLIMPVIKMILLGLFSGLSITNLYTILLYTFFKILTSSSGAQIIILCQSAGNSNIGSYFYFLYFRH